MDKIIKKDIVNGVEYKYNGIGGGGSITDNNVIYISQADYDNLTPAEKADTTKNYVIIGQGGIPVPTEIDAEDVNFDNTGTSMQSDNVQDAIEEVFQSVSNGKELIADAITDKGVSTSATDSFATMATNISNINGLDSSITQSGLGLGSSDLAWCEGIWGNYTNSLSYCNAEVDGVLYSIGTVGEYDYTSHERTNDSATYIATVVNGDTINQFKGTCMVLAAASNYATASYSSGTTYYQDGNKIYLAFGTTTAINSSGYDTLVSLGYFNTDTKEFIEDVKQLYRVARGTAHPDNEKTSTLTKYRIGYTVQEKAFNGTGSAAKNAAVIYPRIYKVS